jgi:hypothetical protein
VTEHLSTADKQVVKDEAKAEKDFQASLTKTATSKESKVQAARKDCESKQEALTKANEAAVKAHSELMAAQKAAHDAENEPEVPATTPTK